MNMCIDMYTNMYIDMCINICGSVGGRACRPAARPVGVDACFDEHMNACNMQQRRMQHSQYACSAHTTQEACLRASSSTAVSAWGLSWPTSRRLYPPPQHSCRIRGPLVRPLDRPTPRDGNGSAHSARKAPQTQRTGWRWLLRLAIGVDCGR